MRLAGHVARVGDGRSPYRILMGRPEGKRALGRPRRRWEDFIRVDPQVSAWGDIDWNDVAQGKDCGFRKMWVISSLAEELLASQEGLCSMESDIVQSRGCSHFKKEVQLIKSKVYDNEQSSFSTAMAATG